MLGTNEKGIHGNKSHAGESEEPGAEGWGNPGGWPRWFQWNSSVLPSFGNYQCFYDFWQTLRCVLTLGFHGEMGVCTSPKHHNMNLHLWAHLYSLLVQTLDIFRGQQFFCPWFTGVTCSQDLSGCLGLFLHCWLSTSLPHQPLAHSHHKQFPSQITPRKMTALNPCLQQGSKISSWLWCHCCDPAAPANTSGSHSSDGRGSLWSTDFGDMKCICQHHSSRRRLPQGQGRSIWNKGKQAGREQQRRSQPCRCSPRLSGNGTTSMSFLKPLKSLSEWASRSNQLPGNNNLFAINHLMQRQHHARIPGLFLLSDPKLKRVSVPLSNLAMKMLVRYSQQPWPGSNLALKTLSSVFWPPDFLQLGQDDWLAVKEGEKQERIEATCGWW